MPPDMIAQGFAARQSVDEYGERQLEIVRYEAANAEVSSQSTQPAVLRNWRPYADL